MSQPGVLEEFKAEWFYEDLHDLLELTPQKDVLFIIGDWKAKVGSQETPGVTGKLGLGVQNEAGQRLIAFCFITYSKAKFACYSSCFLTSYFCIPVPYTEKDIFFGD